jgi:hypothetical protein
LSIVLNFASLLPQPAAPGFAENLAGMRYYIWKTAPRGKLRPDFAMGRRQREAERKAENAGSAPAFSLFRQMKTVSFLQARNFPYRMRGAWGAARIRLDEDQCISVTSLSVSEMQWTEIQCVRQRRLDSQNSPGCRIKRNKATVGRGSLDTLVDTSLPISQSSPYYQSVFDLTPLANSKIENSTCLRICWGVISPLSSCVFERTGP